MVPSAVITWSLVGQGVGVAVVSLVVTGSLLLACGAGHPNPGVPLRTADLASSRLELGELAKLLLLDLPRVRGWGLGQSGTASSLVSTPGRWPSANVTLVLEG